MGPLPFTQSPGRGGYRGWYFRVYVRVRLLEEGILQSWRGWVGRPPVGLGVKRAGSKKRREVGSLFGYLIAGGHYLYCGRVRELSCYSQVLLLPLGVPPTPAPARFGALGRGN